MKSWSAFAVVGLVAVLGGCPADDAQDPGVDAAKAQIQFIRFTSKTWSLSHQGSAFQMSISDAPASAGACALATSQTNGLSAAGVQILIRFPEDLTEECPIGHYSLSPDNCPTTLGSNPLVNPGCGYYRAWDANGTLLGLAVAGSGELTVAGSASSCTLRANIGFLGGTFGEVYTLEANTSGGDPWCQDD